MSVATHLGLEDPTNSLLALAHERWPGWQARHPRLRVVEDLRDLPAWVRAADRDAADSVLLALAQVNSPEGEDDPAATGVLAWLLLPGVSLLAARLVTATARIDEVVAAQLWIEVRTFPWRRGHRVAANVLMNTRKAVLRDLGLGQRADRTWAATTTIAPTEPAWEQMIQARPSGPTPERELADLLEGAHAAGVITDADRALIEDVARAADRQQGTARAGRGYGGLLADGACAEVAGRHGVSPITVRRRTRRTVQALRTAGRHTDKVPA